MNVHCNHETIVRFGLLLPGPFYFIDLLEWKKGMTIADELGKQPITGLIAFICADVGSLIAHGDNRRKCFDFL